MNCTIKNAAIIVAGVAGIVILTVATTLTFEKLTRPTTTVAMTAPAATTTPLAATTPPPVAAQTPAAEQAPTAAPPATSAPASTNQNQATTIPVAQIIEVKPHYVTKKVPYRVCRQVQDVVYVQRQQAIPGSGAVVGGIVGGLAGHSIGQGRGNQVATIAGAVIGAIGGQSVENRMNEPVPQVVYRTVCTRGYTTKQVQRGYVITYVYQGQQKTKIVSKMPTNTTTLD